MGKGVTGRCPRDSDDIRMEGKQYVVISAGGHAKLGSKLGDAVLAFAL